MVKIGGRELVLRAAMSCAGVLICGVSVGMFRTAALGVDPFQSLMGGLNRVVHISFGTLYIVANACLLCFSLLLDRRKIGLATLINLTLLGYAAEFFQTWFTGALPGLEMAGRLAGGGGDSWNRYNSRRVFHGPPNKPVFKIYAT